MVGQCVVACIYIDADAVIGTGSVTRLTGSKIERGVGASFRCAPGVVALVKLVARPRPPLTRCTVVWN